MLDSQKVHVPRIFGTSVRERPSDRLLLEAAQEMIRQRWWQQLRHKGDRNLATTLAGMVEGLGFKNYKT